MGVTAGEKIAAVLGLDRLALERIGTGAAWPRPAGTWEAAATGAFDAGEAQELRLC